MKTKTKTPETVSIQRVLSIADLFWDETDEQPVRSGEIVYERPSGDGTDDEGGTIVIRPWADPDLRLMISGQEFLALLRFLVQEGLLQACGVQPAAGDGPRRDAPAEDPLAAGNGHGNPEAIAADREATAPFPLPPLRAEAMDAHWIDDAEWLRDMHQHHGLDAADIAAITGTTYARVRTRLKRYDIP